MTVRKVDALDVARAVHGWDPVGTVVELTSADRVGLREQLAEHLLDAFKLNGDGDVAERFYSIATSPFVSVRVEPEVSS